MNKTDTWLEGMHITEPRKQQNIIDIRKQYNLREDQFLKKEGSKSSLRFWPGWRRNIDIENA